MIIQLGFKRVYLAIVEIPKEDTIKQIGFHDNTVRIQKSISWKIPKEDTIKQIGFHDNTVRIDSGFHEIQLGFKRVYFDSGNTKGRYNKTNRLS